MDGRTDGWTDGRMEGRMDGRTNRRTDGQTDRQLDGRMDGRTEITPVSYRTSSPSGPLPKSIDHTSKLHRRLTSRKTGAHKCFSTLKDLPDPLQPFLSHSKDIAWPRKKG